MMAAFIWTLAVMISVGFGCNFVVRDTSSDKAAVPLNVCYGSSYFQYTMYKCEDNLPFKYIYSSSDNTCSGDHITRESAADQTYTCEDDTNCPYARVVQYSDCDDNEGTTISAIEAFVVGQCTEGTQGTCTSTFAEVTRYNDAPNGCTGGHSAFNKEEYFGGCVASSRGNLYQWDIECGSAASDPLKLTFVAVFVVFISLYTL